MKKIKRTFLQDESFSKTENCKVENINNYPENCIGQIYFL